MGFAAKDDARVFERVPTLVRILTVLFATIGLVLLFMVLSFPYERLRGSFAERLTQATGVPVSIGELTPQLSLLGPGFEATEVRAQLRPDPLTIDRLRIRPAWSMSWLAGRPAFAIELSSALGDAEGILLAGSEPGFKGVLKELDFAKLPISAIDPGTRVTGQGTSAIALRAGSAGAVGEIQISGQDGSIQLAEFPFALPYSELEGEVSLTEGGGYAIRSFTLDGPMVAIDLHGTVGRASRLDTAPLELQMRLELREPSAAPMLRQLGVPLGSGNSFELQIGGTVGRPVVR